MLRAFAVQRDPGPLVTPPQLRECPGCGLFQIVPAMAALGAATFSPPMPLRSTMSVVLATRHPSLRSPMMWS